MKDITILLIDDEEDYSETMAFYLKSKGYKVIKACSGQDGIAYIKEFLPNIVFLDFRMPDMNGVEALKVIRGFAPDLSVIMVTAYASDIDVLEALKLGASSIFPKGADFSTAAKLINEVLN